MRAFADFVTRLADRLAHFLGGHARHRLDIGAQHVSHPAQGFRPGFYRGFAPLAESGVGRLQDGFKSIGGLERIASQFLAGGRAAGNGGGDGSDLVHGVLGMNGASVWWRRSWRKIKLRICSCKMNNHERFFL
ncbi:hypothetical protein D9M69_658250 [compost metagenome]